MHTVTPDWTAIREEFPILRQEVHGHPLVYLDNAATSQKPHAVLDAVDAYYQRDNANVHRGAHELSGRATEGYETARRKVAAFIGAKSAEEIIFTRGVTEGINLVANSWGSTLRPGDVILLTEIEHHSNLVPWQLLAARTGAKLRFLPVNDEDGTLAVERLGEFLTPEVKLFAFTHISNSLGTINPVAEFCAAARTVGALSLVDAAQSAGHLPVDVQAIGCDFLAMSGHKMCAPTGIGALYIRSELMEALPPWHGGGEMIVSVKYESSTFKTGPHKFEAGTPNIGGAIGLGAAVDYLDRVGRANIFAHDQQLAKIAAERIRELPGYRVLGPKGDRGGVVSFTLEGAHPHDVTTFADRYGVALRGGHHCNQPLMRKWRLPGTSRASFYFYNTAEEVDILIDVLTKAAKFFA